MKTVTSIQEDIRIEREDTVGRMNEANKYLNFAKEFYKKKGVSGPFDAKFKKDKKAQKELMGELSKEWAAHKKKAEK